MWAPTTRSRDAPDRRRRTATGSRSADHQPAPANRPGRSSCPHTSTHPAGNPAAPRTSPTPPTTHARAPRTPPPCDRPPTTPPTLGNPPPGQTRHRLASENPSSARTAHNRHRVTTPQPASPPPTDRYVPPDARPPLRHHERGPTSWPSVPAGPQPPAEPAPPARHPSRQPTE